MATDLGSQSTSAASNTTVGGISIAEGCAPANVNDGMRAMIAQSKGALLAPTSGGAANVQTLTYAPAVDGYVSGWPYPFKAGFTNTGSATMNINGLGAKTMKRVDNTAAAVALAGGEIVAGGVYVLFYDGTDLLVTSPTVSYPVGAVATPGIAFAGDLNSGLYWIGADNIGLSLGGTKRVDFKTTGVGVPDGAFNTPALFFNSNVDTGFWLSGTDIKASIDGVVNHTWGAGAYTLASDDSGAGAAPSLTLDRNSGTPAASDAIGEIRFSGRDSGSNTETYIQVFGSIIDPTNASEDATLSVATLIAGSLGTRLIIGAGLYHGSATGGDKGNNTINFGAVYDDNVLLCRPVHRAVAPVPDAVWDEVSPTGKNKLVAVDKAYEARGLNGSAAKFAEVLEADATAPGLFTLAEMQARKAAGEKFSVGERTERLWIAVEYAALAIRDLTQKNAELTARLKAAGL